MQTSDFDYDLPPSCIAQRPGPRGESRLLRLAADGAIGHHRIADLPRLLRSGDLLVVNDTQVIPARLQVTRTETGGRLELLLVERLAARQWLALARPARRAVPGRTFDLEDRLRLQISEKRDDGQVVVEFSEPIEPHLERFGHVPLPPYIRRPDDRRDRTAYQTVYARRPGAVAAPTAGLHFTRDLLDELERAGIGVAAITLHVGIGTFRPVAAERIEDHRMDSERFEIPAKAVEAIRKTRCQGGRIVAVGTTVVRTLESAVRKTGTIEPCAGRTDLFIRPGFRFAAVDLLLTNFHLPRSTLLMLVSAFAGRDAVIAAYRQAIAAGYRFYSYGDCMLAERLASCE